MAKRTTAQRRKAAKESWARRKAGLGPLYRRKGKKKVARTHAAPDIETQPVGYITATPGYEALARELHAAFDQSAHGKGRERHANGRPFDRQPILELARMYGPGFSAGQAAKKAQEALGMATRGNVDAAIHELHGAIVYLAATASLLREG